MPKVLAQKEVREMARTSRKEWIKPEIFQEKEYKVGFYLRVSAEEGNPEENSLKNQADLLEDALSKLEVCRLVKCYEDNGYSGTNFKRPAFVDMMKDVKKDVINTIMVKDLSRFGRNYVGVGDYLERIFPMRQVRFISVNDGLDTLTNKTTDQLIFHLLNITNEIYAKDISSKIGPVLQGKQIRGEFLGPWPLYGYLRDPKNPKKLIIDPETAPVVQRIFQEKVQGKTSVNILNALKNESILSPSAYRSEKGLCRHEKYKNAPWNLQNIQNILQNQKYLGHTIGGKKRSSLIRQEKNKIIPKSQWIVVKNTHEAIISEEMFQKAQEILEETRKRRGKAGSL